MTRVREPRRPGHRAPSRTPIVERPASPPSNACGAQAGRLRRTTDRLFSRRDQPVPHPRRRGPRGPACSSTASGPGATRQLVEAEEPRQPRRREAPPLGPCAAEKIFFLRLQLADPSDLRAGSRSLRSALSRARRLQRKACNLFSGAPCGTEGSSPSAFLASALLLRLHEFQAADSVAALDVARRVGVPAAGCRIFWDGTNILPVLQPALPRSYRYRRPESEAWRSGAVPLAERRWSPDGTPA